MRALKSGVTPMDAVLEAGSAWLETPAEAADREYRARRDRFLRACERMMLAQGWRPPEPAGLEQLEEPAERAAFAG